MSEPLHQLPVDRMRKVMQKRMLDDKHYCTNEAYNWKLAEEKRQRYQRWIYGFVTATVLALIGFLLAGGCR